MLYDGQGWNELYGYGVVSAPLVLSPPDYVLSSPRSITLGVGGSAAVRIVAAPSGGAVPLVSFALSGLPEGTMAAFDPPACAVPCSTTLTLTTAPSTPPGSYPITVTGEPPGRQTTFMLRVGRSPRR